MIVQNLDGNGAMEPGIQRFVDFAHSAGADQFDNFVMAQPRACCY